MASRCARCKVLAAENAALRRRLDSIESTMRHLDELTAVLDRDGGDDVVAPPQPVLSGPTAEWREQANSPE